MYHPLFEVVLNSVLTTLHIQRATVLLVLKSSVGFYPSSSSKDGCFGIAGLDPLNAADE